jgi:hypothetical protein
VSPPPIPVLQAWGLDRGEPLEGGEERAFVPNDLVLKPVLDVRQALWLAELLAAPPEHEDLRIVRPVAARSGA